MDGQAVGQTTLAKTICLPTLMGGDISMVHKHVKYMKGRNVTQKVSTQELRFLHYACRLMLVNTCMKFHEDILNVFKVIEET